MGRHTTHSGWLPSAGLGLFVLAAACTVDPDPGEVSRELGLASTPDLPDEQLPPAPPVALLATAAVPLGETGLREELAARRPLDVAMGHDAAEIVDPAVAATFAGASPDLHGSFHDCTDREAVNLVLAGRAQCALLRGKLTARDLHAGLRQTQVGLELFAIAVATDFPARSLSRTQIRLLLTGQVTEWKQLGIDAGPVVVVVPADRRLAERAARLLIPGEAFGDGAVRTADDDELAQRLRGAGTLGVVRTTEHQPPGRRLLPIDWTPPSAAAHASGNYPYAIPVHVVTPGQPMGRALQFLQFLQSPEGRDLLGRTLLLP